LLVVTDRAGNLFVYFDGLAAMAGAITRRHGKSLNREKIGQDFLLAYDESKKLLAVVSSDKVRHYVFAYVIAVVSHVETAAPVARFRL
jgi:hypothetical protein